MLSMKPCRRCLAPVRLGLAFALACAAGALAAQSLQDPTQPLDGPAAVAGRPAAAQAPSISLVRDADGRYRLLHDGRWLRVGQRLGDARITRITETGVWLQADGETRHWPRYPAVTVRPAGPPRAGSSPSSTPPSGRSPS